MADLGISAVATAQPGPVGGLQAIAVVMPAHAFPGKFGEAVRGLHRLNPAVDVSATKRSSARRVAASQWHSILPRRASPAPPAGGGDAARGSPPAINVAGSSG